jgi:prepilin peptidase CpaA
MLSFIPVITVAIAAVAAAVDMKTGRIPNALTFGATLAALLFHAIDGGVSGFGWALAGCGIGLAVFFPFFALGGLGAGDVKLVAALGTWLGPLGVLRLAAGAGIAGGVVALVVMLHARYLGTAARNLLLLLTHWRVNGVRPLPELTLAGGSGPRLAYAVPILLGTLGALWWR